MRKVSREEDGGVVYSSINVKCFVTFIFFSLDFVKHLKEEKYLMKRRDILETRGGLLE